MQGHQCRPTLQWKLGLVRNSISFEELRLEFCPEEVEGGGRTSHQFPMDLELEERPSGSVISGCQDCAC
jgi:hypothetical protein